MSAADAQAEPTMEEILASIRRIISEDDAAPAASAPADAEEGFGDDVLELTDTVAEMPETVSPDFDFDALPTETEYDAPMAEEPALEAEPSYDGIVVEDRWADPEPEIMQVREPYQPPPPAASEPVMAYQAPQPAPNYAPDNGLVSEPVADIASEVFSQLSPAKVFPEVFASGNSVEALVVAMLRPMLKEWLDANLPRIVEDKVETEVARIARRSF
jgi:uncharacterized protein